MSITITTEEDFKKHEEELAATIETLLKIKKIRYKEWETHSEIEAWILEKDLITTTFKAGMEKFSLSQLQAYFLAKQSAAGNGTDRFELFKRFQGQLTNIQAALKNELDPENHRRFYMGMGITEYQAAELVYLATLYPSVKGAILMNGYMADPTKDFFGQEFYGTGRRGNDILRQATRVLTHFGHQRYAKCNSSSAFQNKLSQCGVMLQSKKVPLFSKDAVQFLASQIPDFSRKSLVAQFLTEKVIAHVCFHTLTDSWVTGGKKQLALSDKRKLIKFAPAIYDACYAALSGCEDFWFSGVRKDKMKDCFKATIKLFVETIHPLLGSNKFKTLSKVEMFVYTMQLKSMLRAYDRYHLLLLEKLHFAVVGDSVTVGYGLDEESHRQSFTRQLVRNVRGHFPCEGEINAIVGAETGTGVTMFQNIFSRQKLSNKKVTVSFIMLGGNNLINGTTLEEMESDIHTMLDLNYRNGVEHVILGFGVPESFNQIVTPRDPNYRRTDYINDYYGLAYQMKERTLDIERGLEEYGRSIRLTREKMRVSVIVLDPHALKPGVEGDMQADGIHPNLGAQKKLVDAATPTVVEAIRPFFEIKIRVFHEQLRLNETPRPQPSATIAYQYLRLARRFNPPALPRDSEMAQPKPFTYDFGAADLKASREHKSPPWDVSLQDTFTVGLQAITATLASFKPGEMRISSFASSTSSEMQSLIRSRALREDPIAQRLSSNPPPLSRPGGGSTKPGTGAK